MEDDPRSIDQVDLLHQHERRMLRGAAGFTALSLLGVGRMCYEAVENSGFNASSVAEAAVAAVGAGFVALRLHQADAYHLEAQQLEAQ